ncbi:MAG: LysR substrate-binding domain-containing protein [Pseudomonadota bacterium]
MISSNLPLSALRGFEAAGRLGSFTQAARELNLTQSAISHQISSLEEALGQPLFIRANRAIHLTDAGLDFLRITRDVLNRLEQGVARLRAYSKPGSLIVAAPHGFASSWLLRRLPAFREAHPDYDVWLYTTALAIDLEVDEVDLVISYGDSRNRPPQARLLVEEKVAPVCAPSFAERHELIDPADVTRVPLIHDERSLGWTEWCAAAGVDHPGVERGANFSDSGLVLAAAELGQGLALAGLALAAEDVNAGRLTVPFGPTLETDEAYVMAAHPDLIEREPIVAFTAWIETALQPTLDAIATITSRLDISGTDPTIPKQLAGGQP